MTKPTPKSASDAPATGPSRSSSAAPPPPPPPPPRVALSILVAAALLALASHARSALLAHVPTSNVWHDPPRKTAVLMRASTHSRKGGPEVMRTSWFPRPERGPGRTLVRVRAAGLNPVDYKMRKDAQWPIVRLPSMTGRDFAGDVVETEPGSGFAVGDRVYGTLPSGLNSGWGTFGEYVASDDAFLAKIPSALNYSEAAAIPLAALTVMQAFQLATPFPPRARVLVTAGAGGVGHLAVQYASKVLGLEVWTTSTSVELCKSLGAAHVVDYRKTSVAQAVGGERPFFDVVVDMIGGTQTAELMRLVKPDGVFVNIFNGAWMDVVGSPELGIVVELAMDLRFRVAGLLGLGPRYENELIWSDARELAAFGEHVANGTIRVVIEREYEGLDEMRAMFERIESGRVKGKLVMLVP